MALIGVEVEAAGFGEALDFDEETACFEEGADAAAVEEDEVGDLDFTLVPETEVFEEVGDLLDSVDSFAVDATPDSFDDDGDLVLCLNLGADSAAESLLVCLPEVVARGCGLPLLSSVLLRSTFLCSLEPADDDLATAFSYSTYV